MAEDVTFRDAGIRSPLLRTANRLGALIAPRWPSLDPAALEQAASKKTGLYDFGEPSYREGLEAICDSLESEAQLHTLGRNAFRGMLVATLSTRLQVLDWARRNPDVRLQKIEKPFVICGMPRTGTTLLSLLLDLDPRSRSLLSWEARSPIPPPQLATYREDPRIAEDAKTYTQLDRLIPPLAAMHPFGPTLPQECQPLLALGLCALQFETQALLPSYGRWLESADARPAYAIHELVLQLLQASIPTDRWSLKTPQHLWHLEALFKRYPDARVIWTHRDPTKVIPSVASLNMTFYRTWMNDPDPRLAGAEWNRKLELAVTRGIEYDRKAEAEGRSWCCHVQYEALMDDPIAVVRSIYSHFGEEPSELHVRLMKAWIAERPQSAHGRHRYDMHDFGFTSEGLDEQYAEYRDRFGVPQERRD
jgi:hypothetical protein